MGEWETIVEFKTPVGVLWTLQQRYDYSERKYECRLCHKARDTRYVRDHWYVQEKVTTNEY